MADIGKHFREHVEPQGLKALIVTPDRETCVQYKREMDHLLAGECSAVIISSSANDTFEFKQEKAIAPFG